MALACVGLFLCGAVETMAAQPGANPVAAKKPVASKAAEGKKQVLRFDALTITGEAAQPQVYYLLNRRQIFFKHEPVKKDLVEQIRKTVEDEPF